MRNAGQCSTGESQVATTTESSIFFVTLISPDGTERSLAVPAKEHIWDAAQNAGIHLPALCHQGWCLTCAGKLEGEPCVNQEDSAGYYAQDRAAGFVLLCTGKPCSDLRIRTHQARAMRQHRRRLRLPAPYAGV